MDTFIKGLALIGGEPRHIWNKCIRLVVETGNDTQNALKPVIVRKSLMEIV